MPLALLALTISAFAIGTTEFVIVGLVPTIANQLCYLVTLSRVAGVYLRPWCCRRRAGADGPDRTFSA